MFHLRRDDPSLFEARALPGVRRRHLAHGLLRLSRQPDGIVKIANHGTGIAVAPTTARAPRVTAAQEAALRAMLRDTFPALVDAPIVTRRLCVVLRHASTATSGSPAIPRSPNVVVATGGSGHAFKFAPVLGDLIATIALGDPHPLAHKFRWRTDASPAVEAARYAGET